MTAPKTRVAVMVSGGGTNLQAILDYAAVGKLPDGEIVCVLSDKPDAYALERARNHGVEAIAVDRKACAGREEFEQKMIEVLESRGVELIVMAGFLRILSADFTDRFENRMINVHPSLIPSFCGKGFYGLKVHEAALEYGVKLTGATVHYVNSIPDGGQIIEQKAVRIKKGDTPETLQRRVMEQAEWKILPAAVQKICRQIRKEKENG
ncbi:MAG: phosphoribosylglycinamide formyltransferase [Clostridia bacterium]|nr:phosphoribosylglycinamide formyltransferase [Clostridia bacterium]